LLGELSTLTTAVGFSPITITVCPHTMLACSAYLGIAHRSILLKLTMRTIFAAAALAASAHAVHLTPEQLNTVWDHAVRLSNFS
jgi:hypothetical protein